MAAAAFLMLAALQCPPPADYVAGVDAHGWAVAPADLPSEKQFPSDVRLDLDVPAAHYTKNPALNQHFPYAELNVGTAQIDSQSGDVSLNSSRSSCNSRSEAAGSHEILLLPSGKAE